MRISIVGLPGSGKSTLAKQISERFNIPHIHIDTFWFEAGGKLNATEEEKQWVRAQVQKRVKAAITQEHWVSDGLYARIQPLIAEKADRLVVLEFPLWRLLLNHVVRMCNRKNRHHPLSLWDDIAFLKEIVDRRLRKGAVEKIRALAVTYQSKAVTLRSRHEIQEFLTSLTKRYARTGEVV